jgi:DNA-binding SARP family transcriptional activator
MSSDLARLEITCFGPPTALVDGGPAPPEVLWRKHLALLAYLALSPNRRRTRDHLLGLLWAEQPQADARHALNQTVSRLRRALGDGRLRSEGDALALHDAGLNVDALRFAAASESAPDEVLPLLRGDFLEGFHLDDAPAFDGWMTLERERYRALAAAALVAAGERRVAGSQFTEARDLAHRALAVQPHAEPAVRLLMRAAALSDDAAGALAAFHDFGKGLHADIGEQPSRGLAALSERIRRQVWRPAPVHEADPEPPLVGRAGLHREVFQYLAAGLVDGPRTVLITSAPGMGRTRLLTECVQRLVLDGAVVARARPLASDHDAPWSTLRLLIRAGIHTASGLAAAAPEALGVLSWLVPELADRFPSRAPRDTAEVAAALASVVRAVAEETPIGLALDDAQWSDRSTLAAVLAAMDQLRGVPVVLLLTVGSGGETAPAELLLLRKEIGRRLPGVTVELGPFSIEETRILVAPLAPWCNDDTERDRLARRLHYEAGGNPFFAVTLLGGLRRLIHLRGDFVVWPRPQATFDTPLPISVPILVRMAVAARVAELDAESLRVLSRASIGALALDLDLIATLADLPRNQIEEALPALERRQLIAFDGQRYAFTAPLIADVVRGECLTPGQRKALRQRAIATLGSRDDLESRVLRAELLAKTEPGVPSFDEAIAVARQALAAGTSRTARRALAAAERSAGQESGPERSLISQLKAQVRD